MRHHVTTRKAHKARKIRAKAPSQKAVHAYLRALHKQAMAAARAQKAAARKAARASRTHTRKPARTKTVHTRVAHAKATRAKRRNVVAGR